MSTAQNDVRLRNLIDGQWRGCGEHPMLDVLNPATGERLTRVPVSSTADVADAVAVAAKAHSSWREVPAGERVKHLYVFRALLETHRDELARLIVLESGKTLAEAAAELQRGIENVEVACGIPMLLQGDNSENIASGIDEHMFRQPLGVVAVVTPFNFPAMIPLWFIPYALACGNCVVFKPSEKVPMTAVRLAELLMEAKLPDGVLQLVHGRSEVVEALCDHPGIAAISLVGSSQTARAVYARATAQGKRAQCQGGAKNVVVVLPDADVTMTTRIVADSAFGCAGQRCLAASTMVTVDRAYEVFRNSLGEAARTRQVGYGLDEGVQMGPVISSASRSRIHHLIDSESRAGAKLLVDGRDRTVQGYDNGYFVHPTILDGVDPVGAMAKTEVFGPVLGLMRMDTVEQAIAYINAQAYGNMACLFTASGRAAREFRHRVQAGNVGINIGVAAPMAQFPFSGWKQSFFGDLHAQGRHGVEFFTQTKVVIERWPEQWSRTF
jgi:malonate-semialdehyde dehydrogenase (acetylating)/methylmalonate-semialdehyde dehydrogenase